MARGPRAATGAKIIATGMMLSATLLGTALIASAEPAVDDVGGLDTPPVPDTRATPAVDPGTSVRGTPTASAPARTLPANPAAVTPDGAVAAPTPIVIEVPAPDLPAAPVTRKS